MEIGLCLSFCNKRWKNPQALAEFVDSLGVRLVQFSWDLVNPWWEEGIRDELAGEYARAFRQRRIEITISFSGMAAYAYSSLLSEDERVRKMGMDYLKRAVDMTAAMGIPALGPPAGCMESLEGLQNIGRKKADIEVQDAGKENHRGYVKRGEVRKRLVDDLILLSRYGAQKGLKQLYLEPTPVQTEIPCTALEAGILMEQLSGKTQIPVGLVLDWGHVLCPSFNEEPADMNYWLSACKGYVGACHIQQCDGKGDRHWGFTRQGIVTPEMIRSVLENPDASGIIHYLEYCPAFETPGEEVIKEIRDSVKYLQSI